MALILCFRQAFILNKLEAHEKILNGYGFPEIFHNEKWYLRLNQANFDNINNKQWWLDRSVLKKLSLNNFLLWGQKRVTLVTLSGTQDQK